MRQNWVEWATLGISVIVIAGVVGFLAVDGLTNRGERAMPSVTMQEADGYETDVGWLVPATLRNEGDAPAERVVIEASAEVNGEPQTSSIEVDFLPSRSQVAVSFGFDAEPRGEVTVRVVGFQAP